MSGMTTSDRVSSSREVKALILEINEIYKETKEVELMDIMKRLTVLKKKIEKRLNGKPTIQLFQHSYYDLVEDESIGKTEIYSIFKFKTQRKRYIQVFYLFHSS